MERTHVCGLMGFNPMLGDRCAACESARTRRLAKEKVNIDAETLYDMLRVDPNMDSLYASTTFLMDIDEIGSYYMDDFKDNEKAEESGILVEETLMSDDELTNLFETGAFDSEIKEAIDDWEDEDDSDPLYTVQTFLMNLEEFLDGELDDDSRGNVFLTQNGNGLSVNLLVGAPFANSDDEINQVNVIIAPTDRELLGSKEVSMDDRIDTETDYDDDDLTTHEVFDDAMNIL